MSSPLRNAASNFLAGLLPALVLLVTTPILVRGLGADGYGTLVLILSITGYMSMFDINMTAGSVKFIAEYQAKQDPDKIMQVVCFGIAIYAAIALVGATLLFFGAPWLGAVFVKSPGDLTADLIKIAALGFVFGQFQAFLMSVPQGMQRYDISARIETLFGTLAPILSASIVYFGANLAGVVWLRNLLGGLSLIVLTWACSKLLGRVYWSWPPQIMRQKMLGFTAFAYLSRIASVTYTHADKLVIGAVLGAKDVAYFAVPTLLANRIFSLSFRLIHMVFPMSSALLASKRITDLERLLLTATRYTFYLNAAAVAVVCSLSGWFLSAWLGPDFAVKGRWIMTFVAGGALLDSLTNVPALVTDGGGRTRLTGSFAFARCLVGLAAVYLGAKLGGIEGVAIAHLATSTVFTVAFLTYFFHSVLRLSVWTWFRDAIAPGALVGMLMTVGAYLSTLLPISDGRQTVTAAVVMAAIGLLGGWYWILEADVRRKIILKWQLWQTTKVGQ